MKKTVYTILITAIIILAQSCKSDMVKENFRFADQQIEYALQLVDSVIQNDNRDDDTKAKNPLVSPRTIDDEGNLKMVRARDWTSGFFPGELWFMYEYTKDNKWRERAEEFTENLEGLRNYKGTHDLGFFNLQ